MEPITFKAIVYTTRTLADGGIRISLDLAGTDENLIAMTELGASKIHNVILEVTAQPMESENVHRTTGRRKAKERI